MRITATHVGQACPQLEEERPFLRHYGLVLDTTRGRYLMEDEKDKARSNWIIIQHMHTMAHPMNRKAGHANNN